MVRRRPTTNDMRWRERLARAAAAAAPSGEDAAFSGVGRVFRARRPPTRDACFTPGWIEVGGQRHEVVISDLTHCGARVDCARRLELPAMVVLSVPARNLRRSARVAWRQGRALGLEFAGSG